MFDKKMGTYGLAIQDGAVCAREFRSRVFGVEGGYNEIPQQMILAVVE